MNEEEKKKNIALLIPSLGGGGAERVASELSKFFVEKGHNVYIFTEKKCTNYKFEGSIVLLRPKQTCFLLSPELENLYSLTREIKLQKRKLHIDTAISFMERYNWANVLSKGKEKVIVRVCTTLSARTDLEGLYYNKVFLKHIYNKADRVIVLSRYGKNDMINNYGIKEKKLIVIPNAVIPRCFDNIIPWEYGNKVILSVNRIHSIKQQGILIDAMKEIIKVIPEAKLLLVGKDIGKYANGLKQIVKKNGLEESVIFIGQVNNVEYYMNHSQVLVLTSVTEGFPNVVIEGMNQGIPVISTDYPGPAREILGASMQSVYGKYGIVVPMINESIKDIEYYQGIKKLRTMLIEVLTNNRLAERYSVASKIRAKHYSKDKVENLWRKIL